MVKHVYGGDFVEHEQTNVNLQTVEGFPFGDFHDFGSVGYLDS